MTEEELMWLAIRKAQEGMAAGQSPFGAALVRSGQVVAVTHNSVWRDGDPTAHAEVNCIRAAARALQTIFLTGCTVYSTTEPCPMCLAALHWARIERVVYGASIADAAAAGFHELCIDPKTMVQLGQSPLRVEGGLLSSECADLFVQWQKSGQARPY
ncbi:MAG TPA: nucleoside deaminase [Gemmataceae bacterium]|jgi:tRNA(Arg) A34 adenosine deaminase TadA|nr:nucleoside deaminase [Gemmataceae bacterium]